MIINADNLTKHNSLKDLYVKLNERDVSSFNKHNSPRTVLDAVHFFSGTDYALNRRELCCVYFVNFFLLFKND